MYYSLHILLTALLLIASYKKTRNSQSKESRNQNLTYDMHKFRKTEVRYVSPASSFTCMWGSPNYALDAFFLMK